jgi:hypothetical protein
MRYLLWILLFVLTAPVAAQEVTPAIPNAAPTPLPDDPRLTICSAPSLAGFVPHIIRPGDRLADLLTGTPNISVTQLAALNCIDDPAALPVGAVVWIPGNEPGEIQPRPAREPQIIRLEASATTVQNQGEVTIHWEAEGAATFFYRCPADSALDCSRPTDASPLPLEHSLTLTGFQYAGEARYRLEARGTQSTVHEDITFTITCSQAWLGPITGFATCPQEPALAVFAVWQPFEGGVMLWFSDSREIWVMTNTDNRVQVFTDTYVDGDPDPADDAPENRFTPERGFGKVWESLGGGASPLGWAYAPETGFDSARQVAGSRAYTTYIQGPGATVYAVTIIPQLEIGLWTQVAG